MGEEKHMCPKDSEKPAIAGGPKACRVPWEKAKRYGEEELSQLKEALGQGTLFYSQGKKVSALESAMAKKYGMNYAIAASSGTTAIHSAIIAAGISPGEEVLVPPVTDMGTLVPILWQGAVPVFVDLEPDTYEMSPEAAEAAITPKTKAVIAVHLWGNPCDMDALEALCKKHDLMLIEDCAQAWGAVYKGRPVGTMGAMGCFSLNEFKHISCGDGGLTVTQDEQLARRLRLATDKCYSREANVAIRQPRFLANNYRMTELQGAVSLAQFEKLDSIVARRGAWCEKLSEGLAGAKCITLPRHTKGAEPSWWFYMFRVNEEVAGVSTDEFAEALQAEGLPVAPHYIGEPMYRYPVFKDHSAYDRGEHPFSRMDYSKASCPVAEKILKTCIQFAANEGWSEENLREAVEGILKVDRWFAEKAG